MIVWFASTVVNDWNLYEKLLDHLLARHVKTEAEYHPILMSEPPVSVSVVSTGSMYMWYGETKWGEGALISVACPQTPLHDASFCMSDTWQFCGASPHPSNPR